MNTPNSKPANAGKESNALVTVTEVAEQVGREILESKLEPGAWATALYESGGKRQEALALYARLRVRKLTKQRRIRLAKVRSFESRRLSKCMGDNETREMIAKTIQDMLINNRSGQSKNFMKPRLSIIWLFVLFIGTAGTVASLGRLFLKDIPESLGNPVTLVSLLAGVGAVWGALVLRVFLPKRWIMLGWNTGLVVTCNVVCLSSLFLGTKVIKRAIAIGADPAAVQQSPMPLKTAQNNNEPKRNTYLVSTRSDEGPAKN
ncbi:MAG: hypothetical protein MUF13_07480 [Akkermansiaceae bacterium]|jgi:hypothetical protein|nr:hypothetical protein [Akkermansiaceae bacterium]